MINIEEVNGEIARLESQPTTMVTIEKLASLYIVRDHLTISPVTAAPVTGDGIPQGESEYYCACAGKTISEVMGVMDDLMNTLMVIQPRLYSAVMLRLNPV